MVYRVTYALSGSLEVEAATPELAKDYMLANQVKEIFENLDFGSLTIESVVAEGQHSQSDFEPAYVDPKYARRAV